MYEVFRFQGFCLILSPSDDHCFYYTYQKKPCQFIFTQTFGMVWYFKYSYQMQHIWFPARCSVRVFERYSAMGGNRVSLNITLFQNGNGPVKLSAITSGGSQAMLFKINTFGESAFLDRLREILD